VCVRMRMLLNSQLEVGVVLWEFGVVLWEFGKGRFLRGHGSLDVR
jgi:hypothetical protein